MMIWLPHSDFVESAKSMDLKTLTIQRFEVWRLWHAYKTGGPVEILNSPIGRMWDGYHVWLVAYGNALVNEWVDRLQQRTEFTKYFRDAADTVQIEDVKTPGWLGSELLHSSHRSNMIRLAPEHYIARWGNTTREGLPIWWPSQQRERN